MDGILEFHDELLVLCILISCLILYLVFFLVKSGDKPEDTPLDKTSGNTAVEIM